MWKNSNPAYNFFSQKIFNPPMRPKRHFALKDTFPIETIVKKKKRKNSQNFQNFQNFAKLFFEKKNRKKKSEKKYIFFLGACGASVSFFFRRLRRLFFFLFNRKMKILRKNEKKNQFFFQVGRLRGGPYLKIPSFLKSDATLREQSHFKFGEINRFGPPLKTLTC